MIWLLNYFSRRRISTILKSSRGYEKLKKNNNLEFIDELKTHLSNSILFDYNSSAFLSFLDLYASDVNLEKSTRQFMLSRYLGTNFTREILKSISNENSRFCSPLPYIWLKELSKSGIRVNYFYCLLLWNFELIKFFLYALFELFKLLKKSLILYSIKDFDYNKSYVYFDSLTLSNLPIENAINKYGILPWHYNWSNGMEVDYYGHSVFEKPIILMNGKVEVKFMDSPFSVPILFKNLLYFLGNSLIRIFKTLISLFVGKWWNFLLLREFLFYDVVQSNNGKGLAVRYMFHNSKWIYRPIWTVAAENFGSEICFYFYSTNIERFKKIDKNAECVNFWHLISWPRILVWDSFQESFLNNNVIHESKVEVVGPISFYSSKISNLEIAKNSIAIFDVQPVRSSFYISLGVDQEYYIPEIANQFLSDIIETVDEVGLIPVFKRKRAIGKNENSLYTQRVKLLSQKHNVLNVDPSIPAEEIIEKSLATISMPFTATGIMAQFLLKPSIFYDPTGLILKDDPAAHGIMVINNKVDLKEWLSKL